MATLLSLIGIVLIAYLGFKGLTSDGGGGDDDEGGSSGGGRAVTHNHGSIDQFGNHDD
ncbi:hypothetical protein [Hydrogenophaga sp.]|jgi:threonine/homoserine/homoserine lactone efflux protein|uniref:hypothetical protein n=1 Tax=Hydrogenophaga sp. TaxID=1904254 RepID=UPI0026920D4C|nr:hypothetical protein [Hydrogenophaga sp.]MDO9134006.1 hypothetical protein [Hydrogenophaga sp.]